ncbi:MAG: glycosyltransferase family 1 protein [Micavibrio aeruginosavorus]|uniref:Glycosyltransferase family 1 protein n=1 Tax=Micavibrio aeruginosavorus TaxID=349221 RepID=A0A2W5HME8_9BACT|nr:MAG: glycosyltransferase family 1 protein [Micavibrio aeruginosavorus]
MKIAYLITRMDELGGAQIHVRDLSLWMKSQGHEVSVLTGSFGKVTDFLEEQGIKVYEISDLERRIHPAKDWKAFNQIKSVLHNIRPDILSCHSSKAGLLGRLAAKSAKVKVIFTAHGWAFTDGVPKLQKTIYTLLEKGAGFFSDHVITVSEFDFNLARKNKIVPDYKLTLVHNGMPERPALIRELKDGPSRLMMVARIGPQKDHETLLRALASLKDLSWTLEFIGGGDDTELRHLAVDLQIDDRVLFLGERHDVAELMEKKADLYLLISKWEGFPRSILEAMRSSLPVIASNVGGVSEAVQEGKTGYLVPTEDAEKLSYTLRLVIPDKKLQLELGRAARESFERDFSFKSMAVKTMAVYSSVDKIGQSIPLN